MKSITTLMLIIFCCWDSNAQMTRLVPEQFSTIQNALNVSRDGDVILVSPGTYFENLVWIPEMNGVELRSTDGPEVTIIDANADGRGITIEGDFIFMGETTIDESTVIDGFTVQNGLIMDPWAVGGGILIESASPFLKNLIIKDNKVEGDRAYGGGLRCYGGQPRLEGCIIEGNETMSIELWSSGGGIYCDSEGLTLENVIIRNNETNSGSGWADGGGIYFYDSGLTMENVTIMGNKCNSGTSWAYGGGIYSSRSNFEMTNCLISSNSVDGGGWSYGGGIYTSGFGDDGIVNKLLNCVIQENFTLGARPTGTAIYSSLEEGTVILENTIVTKNGPGRSVIGMESGNGQIVHSTVVNNQSSINLSGVDLEVTNSILWNNDEGIVESGWSGISNVSILHSVVQGGWQGAGNIDADPLLFSDEILIPTENSPCLNAGDRSVISEEDIQGNERPLPLGSAPDIGAYEIAQNFAHVLSRFYFDENRNGVQDETEEFIGRGAISVDGQVEENTKSEGIFTTVTPGEVTINYHSNNAGYWTLSYGPGSYTFDVVEEDFADTIYFGIYPSRPYKDIVAGIYSPALRCSREVTMDFFVKNEGSTIESGVLWAHLDPLVSEVMPLLDPDAYNGDAFGWAFSDLLPGESFVRKVKMKVPGVEDVQQGQLLKFLSEVTLISGQAGVQPFCYEDEVRCAYDPNDKLVNPNRPDGYVLKDQPMTYTIRFQNVGNDYADDVVVVDTLDSNFDYSTFKLLTSSHSEKMKHTLSSDGILRFDFPQIYLPDSTTDLEGSNGYIMYSIKPDSTLDDFRKLENTAHIYFDFNPAIVTNTTLNSAVDMFPLVATSEEDEKDLVIYPNPSTGLINLPTIFDQIRVTDLRGMATLDKRNSNFIDLSSIPDGLYIVKATKGDQSYLGKVVLVKK